MTGVAALSCAAAFGAALVALFSAVISRAPGAGNFRYLAAIATTAAGYGISSVPVTLPLDDRVQFWCGACSLVFGSAHGVAWFLYQRAQAAETPSRVDKVFITVAAGWMVLALIPGALDTGRVNLLSVEWSGATYHMVEPSPLGLAAYGFYATSFGVVLVRYLRRWRGGVPTAAGHALAVGLVLLLAVNDSLVSSGVFQGLLLLDLGQVAITVLVGVTLISHYVKEAHHLAAMKAGLEQTVAARTGELATAHQALVRHEKLAALGQLAAGVAHEINNPAAVVKANLAFIEEEARRSGALDAESLSALADCKDGVERIARIVKQLLHAGRVAGGAKDELQAFNVHRSVVAAVALARVAMPERVEMSNTVPPSLWALGSASAFEQVMVNLLMNACHAVAHHRGQGVITVAGREQDGRTRVSVVDDGPGMTEEQQARLFEPFFTTKPFGEGTGLGLAVSLGLMRSLEANIRLVSSSPKGTAMEVDLPSAAAPLSEVSSLPATLPAAARWRVLLVEDDDSVRHAMQRQLSKVCQVHGVDGVEAALQEVRARPGEFDLILTDVMMPLGGAPRLAEELEKGGSPLASRMVFVTGGATTRLARDFVAARQAVTLDKPFDLAAFQRMASGLLGTRAETPVTQPRDAPA